MGEKVSIAIKD